VLAACSQRPETLSIARCDKPLRYRCALPLSGGLNRQEWNSASYSKRNAIIHRGENATEDEATQALAVARRIVQIMGEI